MTAYNPGDILIYTLMLTCERGTLNLGKCFVTASVYESIFTPGIIADINVLDTDDSLGNLKIVGDETVTFSFAAPGGDTLDYTFHVNSVENNEGLGSTKAKVYTLRCVSKEAISAKANYVSKSYNTQISSIISDIHKTFLGSAKSLVVEATQGIQKIIIPNKKPLEAIDMVRRRATSSKNKSSSYLYFENANGFNFVTMEGLFGKSPVKYFFNSDAVGAKALTTLTDSNIIHYEIIKQADAMNRVELGALKQRIATYDFRTKKYVTKDVTPSNPSNVGGSGLFNSSTFKNMFGSTFGNFSFIPFDSNNRQNTNIPETTPDQLAYTAAMTQISMVIKVNGDTKVKAGDVIYLNIPQKADITSNISNDPLIAGNFLVSRIHREIGDAVTRPRYVDYIEVIKGGLDSGV